ncbi:hypothetical protein FGIG_01087 [Fasciola gigantica]|uniref:SCA7 domain-containing protein n=1 Tax=Fasciola gigantica TaxID=46835 RepID=A0A504YW34_FASGI|nr:hypothetical protein FGIG_01087 [Fasciola gigantica]
MQTMWSNTAPSNTNLSLRHGNSTSPEAQGNTELLPYQAVSCYNDRIDTNIKKERSVSKRSKNASGRARKGTGPIEREIGSLETISETDSLSSLTDDNLKRQPVAFSEDDVENLREPVLLKLAKSECNPNGIDVRSIIPKTDSDSKTCRGDRSVWSVVCSKEATESPPSQKSRIKSQLNIEQSSTDTTRDSGCGTQSCDSVSRTSGTTTHRASSYPPTPTLSPHQSSPTPSNVSDGAVFVFGKLRTEQIDRSRSRSTHSSSSSISIPNEQNELYENSNSWYHPDSLGTAVDRKRKTGPLGRIHSRRTRPHQTVITNQTEQHESQCFQAHLLSERLETRDAEDNQFVNPFDFQDNKEIEMHNQSYQSDRFIPGLRTLSHTNKGTTARNGYHSWLRQVRGGRTASLVARDDGPLRSGYCQPHMDWRRVSGLPSELAYMEQGTGCSSWADIPQPSSSSCRSRGSIQTVAEEDKPFRISSSSLLNVGHEMHEPGKDNAIDPLTHCGCIVLGNLRCRNSLLCPLHTIEEKRLVPRQRDFRQLILEARERQQLSRSVPSTLIRRVVCRPIPDTELCSPIIDLTDDASGPETSDESVENAEAVNNLRMSTFGPGLHPASRTVFRGAGTMDAQAIYHSHLRRRTKLSEAVGSRVDELSHIPSRFARRVIARDSSHPIQPGVSFGMELTPVGDPLPTVCPNVTMDTSGVGPSDPFLSVRHGSTPTDSTYLADAPTVPGLDLPNTSYSARLVAISNRPGSTSAQTRKPVRRPPPQLRRAQPVGLLQSFPPQWSAGGSDPNRNPILSQTSSGLPDASLGVPLDERDPCELVDLLLPGELMSVSGLAVDESVPDSSYRGRMIPTSTPIMLSSVPVTQLPYDSHAILEHQVC